MATVRVDELFSASIAVGIKPLFLKESVAATPLSGDEASELDTWINEVKTELSRQSPIVAAIFDENIEAIKAFAQIAKNKLDNKTITIPPSNPGHIGVTLITPQFIRYAATASSTSPAYSQYTLNTWEISLTAGTEAYLLGDGTNYFRPCPTEGSRCEILLLKNGILEIGTTPKLYQIHMYTRETAAQGPYTVSPLIEIPVETDKAIYVYRTPGCLPMLHDMEYMLGVMPHEDGTDTIPLLGVAFYEYEFLKELKWVS